MDLASWNVHAGVDGWGRPFDVEAGAREIGADVFVLQECWTPADTDLPGTAARVAGVLGGDAVVLEVPLASGRLAGPHPRADARWMRPLDWRAAAHALLLDSNRPLPARVVRSERYAAAQPGSWGIAVVSRLPVVAHRVVELGRLPRDRATRAALVVEITAGAGAGAGQLTVVATHMSHLTYGSLLHYRRLRRAIGGEGPAVLAGDMNLWGPPVRALLPGWRRAVRGRTWPAWRPHSQVDHVLVRGGGNGGGIEVLEGRVLASAGSDHRPVWVRLAVRR